VIIFAGRPAPVHGFLTATSAAMGKASVDIGPSLVGSSCPVAHIH